MTQNFSSVHNNKKNALPVKPPASKKKKLIRKREKLKKNAKLKKKPKRKKKLWPKWLWPLRGKCFGH